MSIVGYAAFNAALIVAAATDLRWMRIPNPIPLVLAAMALVFRWPPDLGDAASRFASFGLVSVAGLALYLLRGLGGGDLKLVSAAALWMPFHTLPAFVTALGVAGGVQGAGALLWPRRQPAGEPARSPRQYEMPYGLTICAAGLWWSWSQLALR